MPARDDCVLWSLTGASGQRTVCRVVEGDEGLALTVEHGDEIVLAEMIPDLEAALARADVVRDALLAIGLHSQSET
jgi:hypothetical protein